jgi:hypothetical protein
MDGILDRLFPQNQMLGLLGDENMTQQARQQGLLGLAAGLLQAGGPSRTRTNIGQALGSGLLAGQQMYNQAVNQQITQAGAIQKLQEAQRQREQQAAIRRIMPSLVQQVPTVAGMQQLVTRDEEGNLLPGYAQGELQINQAAANVLRGALGDDPDKFKKVMEAVEIQLKSSRPPEPKTLTLGEGQTAYALGPRGVATQIAAGAPKARELPTGVRSAALELFGTDQGLTPDQLTQASQLEQKRSLERATANRPLTTVDVKTGQTASNALITSAIQRVDASQAAADSAFTTRQTIANIKPLLDQGVFSGPLSGQATVIARLATTLGVTGQNTQELLNRTSAAMQGLAGLELDAAQAMKGQGAITENERSLIARAAGGNLAQFTSGEVRTLVDALDKVSTFRIASHKRQVDALRRVLPEDAKAYVDAYRTDYDMPSLNISIPAGLSEAARRERSGGR